HRSPTSFPTRRSSDLARASTRRREMAIRAALGAGRWRVIRQLMTESVLLAMLGGALGTLLAHLLVELLRIARPDLEAVHPWNVSMATSIGLDYGVLGSTALLAVLAGILFGIAPAVSASRTQLSEALKEGERG